VLLVDVKSQFCNGMAQYDHCATNPRCQSAPVCYPIPTYNRQLCPPLASKITVSYLESEDVT
ncbi:unnamed protein product, partial [Rotaria magnacalcarata]